MEPNTHEYGAPVPPLCVGGNKHCETTTPLWTTLDVHLVSVLRVLTSKALPWVLLRTTTEVGSCFIQVSPPVSHYLHNHHKEHHCFC